MIIDQYAILAPELCFGEICGENGFMSTHRPTVPASSEKVYQVTKSDLPLSCPMPNMTLWSAHPRVYLPIEKTGKANCPYCGSQYVLVDPQK